MNRGGFHGLHPVPCFVYYAGVVMFCMLFTHPLFLMTVIGATVLLHLYHDRGRMLGKLLPFYLLFGVTVALLNPLLSQRGRHILFYFFDRQVTLEAVLYGIIMAISLLAILFTFASYQQIVTTDKFLYLFGSIAPKVTLLVVMTIRFVPSFTRRMRQISLVQRLKGINVRKGSVKKRMRDGMVLLRTLLVWSLEEGLQTADSMNARGYGAGPRSSYTVFRMGRADWVALWAMIVAGAICIAGRMYGYGMMTIYPRLEQLSFSGTEALIYLFFCAYLLTPAVLEWRDRAAWKS